ncbi:MAG: hypothetical protein CM15mP78_05290 [Candidatus Poseidoniales archaeon]|nr:MAG: hypothetical protein CM15mP78_05290 [Candidatus Poseidoniales archaeon]
MQEVYHPDGGQWKRGDMPRTSFVFLNDEEGLTSEEQSAAAQAEAEQALGAYWNASKERLTPPKSTERPTTPSSATSRKSRNKWWNASTLTTASWLGSTFSITTERVCRNMTAYMQRVVPWWNPCWRGLDWASATTPTRRSNPANRVLPCTLNHRSASRSRASPRAVKWRGTPWWTTEETGSPRPPSTVPWRGLTGTKSSIPLVGTCFATVAR